MRNQLKFILIIFSFLIFFSCKNEKETKNNSISLDKKQIDSISASSINTKLRPNKNNFHRELKSEYKIYSIGHTDLFEVTKTDTTCVIGNNKYTAVKEGYILFNKDTIHLETKMYLEKAFITEDKKNIYIIYTFQEFDSGGSRVLCIDKGSLKINWDHSIGGFNLSKPIADKDIIYISSLDHLSKLSLKSGEFYWRLDSLYDKYKINYVEKTIFQDSLNLYIYKERHPSKEFDTLFVNDITGKITNPDNGYK